MTYSTQNKSKRRYALAGLLLIALVSVPVLILHQRSSTAVPAVVAPQAVSDTQLVLEQAPIMDRPALLDQAVAFIEPFEGRRHRVYEDSLGNRTIGVGFNLERTGAAEDLARLLPAIKFQALVCGEIVLTDAQIDILLRHDTQRAIGTARRQVEGFDSLPRDVQLIVVDMTFNTGSLHSWHNFRAALSAQDYAAAADAMYDSRWRRQTGRRAAHLIERMSSLAQS